jgi:hypothetical protein
MARSGSTRHELTLAVLERKESLWGGGDRKYSPHRSAQNIISGAGNGPPNIDLLRWAAYEATDADLLRVVGSDKRYDFLYYK